MPKWKKKKLLEENIKDDLHDLMEEKYFVDKKWKKKREKKMVILKSEFIFPSDQLPFTNKTI